MKVIVWDIDDVLNDLMNEWLVHAISSGEVRRSISYNNITSNPPHKILSMSLSDYHKSLDGFRKSEKAFNMKPTPEIFKWFQDKGENFCHIAVTARPISTAPQAAGWLFSHFGKWFRSFHFVPSQRDDEISPSYHVSKGELISKIDNVSYFIDDSEENIETVLDKNIKRLLFPRPWNKSPYSVSEILSILGSGT
ncbi:MAG: hypothetical protein HQK54_15510 [Oligoflexales bacterium]|nr:hypothetical protein [Oligoflexales bacterium]